MKTGDIFIVNNFPTIYTNKNEFFGGEYESISVYENARAWE